MVDGMIGARLASLTETQQTMDATAEEAASSGARGVQIAQETEAGLAELTQRLQTHFQQMADELRTAAQRTQSRLDAAEWTGQRRERAVAVGAEFEADLRRVLDESTGHLEEFRARADQAAQACVEQVRGGFGAAMQRADESYRALGAEAAAVRDQLAQIDQTSGLAG